MSPAAVVIAILRINYPTNWTVADSVHPDQTQKTRLIRVDTLH